MQSDQLKQRLRVYTQLSETISSWTVELGSCVCDGDCAGGVEVTERTDEGRKTRGKIAGGEKYVGLLFVCVMCMCEPVRKQVCTLV